MSTVCFACAAVAAAFLLPFGFNLTFGEGGEREVLHLWSTCWHTTLKRKSLQMMVAYGTEESKEDLEVMCEDQGSMLFKRVEAMPIFGEKVNGYGLMDATLDDQLRKGDGAFYKQQKPTRTEHQWPSISGITSKAQHQ